MEINEPNSKSDLDLQGNDLQEGDLKEKIDQAQQQEILSIPIMHEDVIIGKKIIETGKTKISKKVNVEEQLVNIPLIHEEVEIKTIPVNQYVDNIPEAVRYEGDTMIIPVLKEVSVVRIMVVEEIHVTKTKIQRQDSRTVSLRKEEVTIEDIAPEK